jgi:hypothetical protein
MRAVVRGVLMARPHLPPGDFFGAAARTIGAGGFRVGLWIASRPPEAVEGHAHDDAHFILALDDGYRSLAHDPLTPRDAAFGPGVAGASHPAWTMSGTGGNKVAIIPDLDAVVVVTTENFNVRNPHGLADTLIADHVLAAMK